MSRTIADGTDTTTNTEERGEDLRVERGASVAVDGAPAVVLDDDRSSLRNRGSIATTGETETVRVDADRVGLDNDDEDAVIRAEDTAVEVTGRDADIDNDGLIEGDVNGVYFENGGRSSGRLTNDGTIQSDSRAVNIGGSDIRLVNRGDILGTGDQRNGTVYSDATAEDYSIDNRRGAVIDAGEGNQGAGVALQTGDRDGDVVEASIRNRGDIDGRGQAASTTGLAGDGIRIFSGVAEGSTTFRGDLRNSGNIVSESTQGTTSGVRIADRLAFDGTITNERGGLIEGAQNGLYFGDAAHDARVDNDGTIRSDSRAVNIDGTGVDLDNSGRILGTGDQRNGTVYSDATADDYSIDNRRRGDIDAGEGNQGAGVALQTGSFDGDVVEASIRNRGDIDGRGQAASTTGLAGDGIRIFSGVAEGSTTFRGDLRNSGNIVSESTQGTTAGVRIADRLAFDGTITNERGGLIEGAQNGLYFGDAAHDARVDNDGTIRSDSRAVNIDGTGVDLDNSGRILGTGDQRNGTVYSDATADDYSIDNRRRGDIDAGEGNQGAGVALQTGSFDGDVVEASIRNRGDIDGRGQAASTTGLAGDGIRIFSGVAEGTTTFRGDLRNSGDIVSESTQGTTSGVRIADRLAFDGTITNERGGLIEGAQNGLYFGDAAHDARVDNDGTIRSDSRAVNIDGTGVDLFNSGRILGTGDQRNGTVYSDATADDYSIENGRRGVIDAGRGNDGAGISLQTGSFDGDVVSAHVENDGLVRGRGDGEGNLAGDGLRIFAGSEGEVTFDGDIVNRGRIRGSDDGVDIQSGVVFTGVIDNTGRIEGGDGAAIDAADAAGGVTVLNAGRIEGDVLLSENDDVLDSSSGRIDGEVKGNGGNDTLTGGRREDTLDGGTGDDTLTGGDDDDVFVFRTGADQDRVTDFEVGDDRLDVSDFFDDQDDALAAARQVGDDTVVDLDVEEGDAVTLVGIQVDDLSASDFIA